MPLLVTERKKVLQRSTGPFEERTQEKSLFVCVTVSSQPVCFSTFYKEYSMCLIYMYRHSHAHTHSYVCKPKECGRASSVSWQQSLSREKHSDDACKGLCKYFTPDYYPKFGMSCTFFIKFSHHQHSLFFMYSEPSSSLKQYKYNTITDNRR